MATQTFMPVEEYLAIDHRPVPEYSEGGLIERGMPTFEHAETQLSIGALFRRMDKGLRLHVSTEQHVRLAEGHYRVLDVAVFQGDKPAGIPSTPPLVDVEILSPDDRLSAIVERFSQLREWGVKHLWLVDPVQRALSVFGNHSLREVEVFEIHELSITVTPADIFGR